MKKNPVLFVHGIGASASVWKKFDIPDHSLFYVSFSDRFASPEDQVPELAGFINKVLQQTGQEKVILVCHSMGGLVARKYLADHPADHRVEKLVLLSTPNLGSVGLFFNWIPAAMILVGIIRMPWVWPVLIGILGLAWEAISYFRGVLLLSPASWSMRPNSEFLKRLDDQRMPADVKYVAVLSDTKDLPHRLVNLFLFREGGDGAVPLSSQKLSASCVPNFPELNYSEIRIDLPHFAIPRQGGEAVLRALEL